MLDHVTLGVSDIARSKAFYDSALRPLGIERLYAEGDGAADFAFWTDDIAVSVISETRRKIL